MSETISMTDILLTVSVGCNLWFLFLLLYDRIMETRLVRFLRSIAGLWRSLGGTAAKPETVRETPPADTPDIIGKICYLVFALFYVLVYVVTSKSYYTIISSKEK